MSFEDLGVPAHVVKTLRSQGIVTPNPVQRDSIPALLARRDIVIQAPTGSGKTLAFVLPMIDRLKHPSNAGPRALVVAPSRELASQIQSVLKSMGSGLRSVLVVGGVPYGAQVRGLRANPDVVVGCPGRLLDLVSQGVLRLGRVGYLVLDEADEMLDRGFADDVEKLISCTSERRQMVLASATVPDWVKTMIAKHLRDPERVKVEHECEPDLEHALLPVAHQSKLDTLDKLLQRERGQTIVFHRTKHGAKKLARDLNKLGHAAGELQGNLSQNQRDRAMASFRSGRSAVLVATNVAARGIDVADVALVINYELPDTAEWLTHRVGRTARNGASGRALTFISPEDTLQWRKLRKQGAPNLAHVAHDALVDDGQWVAEHQPETDISDRRNRPAPTATRTRGFHGQDVTSPRRGSRRPPLRRESGPTFTSPAAKSDPPERVPDRSERSHRMNQEPFGARLRNNRHNQPGNNPRQNRDERSRSEGNREGSEFQPGRNKSVRPSGTGRTYSSGGPDYREPGRPDGSGNGIKRGRSFGSKHRYGGTTRFDRVDRSESPSSTN